MSHDLLMTYYGDDFTGSTDVMERLEIGGVPTVLFLDVPTQEQLDAFPNVRAVGIAGVSRSMTPAQMDGELPDKFTALAALNAPYFHYKVCSTFDSSPTVGNIGHATEIGWRIFEPPFVPLMIGAPFLRRYVAFGNLFARVGDVTYRLDRHPTMSKHPITPMNEADLRLHLSKQTERNIGLVDLWHMMSKSAEELDTYLQTLIDDGSEIVVFDTLDDHHLAIVGRILWQQRGDKPVFIVGSSGVEAALTSHWRTVGVVESAKAFAPLDEVKQLIVMSGSGAPGTGEQITWSMEHGYAGVRLDAPKLIDPSTVDAAREESINRALEALGNGDSVLLYSANGSDDPAINATRAHAQTIGIDQHTVGHRLGEQQGIILRTLLEKTGIKRTCVAGGDTSGHSARQLGIFALEAIQQIDPGAPLCRAASSDPAFDGLEISLKGGQNGKRDYFESIRKGRL